MCDHDMRCVMARVCDVRNPGGCTQGTMDNVKAYFYCSLTASLYAYNIPPCALVDHTAACCTDLRASVSARLGLPPQRPVSPFTLPTNGLLRITSHSTLLRRRRRRRLLPPLLVPPSHPSLPPRPPRSGRRRSCSGRRPRAAPGTARTAAARLAFVQNAFHLGLVVVVLKQLIVAWKHRIRRCLAKPDMARAFKWLVAVRDSLPFSLDTF